MLLDTVVSDCLQRCMDLCSKRHVLIANNIANVNTPGYKRLDLEFDKIMRQEVGRQLGERSPTELWRTHPQHQTPVREQGFVAVQADYGTAHRNDGNNVDIDFEMALLASNQLTYEAAARLLNGELGLLWKAVSEGRR
ncbi:MAG: flagellar basal body rod protein FlgB [Bacillota bacterium]